MNTLFVKTKFTLPVKAHATDAGLDLCATEDITLWLNKPTLIHTGVSVKLPKNTMAFITPRSSMNKNGVTTCLGTIDEGYTGELLVCLKALHYKVKKGDKIAQLVVLPRCVYTAKLTDNLADTSRGTKGFGSSGK